jgi:hypothetical protein
VIRMSWRVVVGMLVLLGVWSFGAFAQEIEEKPVTEQLLDLLRQRGRSPRKDVYLDFGFLLTLRLMAGQSKGPFSMEELTADLHIDFVEHSLVNELAPSFNIEVMATRYAGWKRAHDPSHADRRNAPLQFQGPFVAWGADGQELSQAPPGIRPTFCLTGEEERAYRRKLLPYR